MIRGKRVRESWPKAIAFALSWEGGYSNDPDDPGGETNFGISKRYHPNEDIKNMTKERAMEIYKGSYWYAMKCDELPYPLDMVVFDCAINPGLGRAQMFLEQSKDWRDVIFYREQHYADRAKKTPKFFAGWINRSLALWRAAKGGAV